MSASIPSPVQIAEFPRRIVCLTEETTEWLYLLGEDLELKASARDFGIDASLIAERLKLSPSERIEYGRAMAEQLIAISPNVRSEAAA